MRDRDAAPVFLHLKKQDRPPGLLRRLKTLLETEASAARKVTLLDHVERNHQLIITTLPRVARDQIHPLI